MKSKLKIFLSVMFCGLLLGVGCVMTGCGKKEKIDPDLTLHLTFDEGEGSVVKDAAGKQQDEKIEYVFSDPKYMAEAQDPQWRKSGAVGGSLLFDGYSNRISYPNSDVDDNGISLSGDGLTIEAWVAPRMFEWDAPEARENGEEHLTAIVSQYNAEQKAGAILGYERHGDWSFQVGTGERYYKVWDNGHPLKKYEWNHVAATFDGAAGEIILYLNGEKVNSQKVIKNSKIKNASRTKLFISYNNNPDGQATANYNMVSGLLDDVMIYSRALSADEVSSYYNGCKPAEIQFEDIWLQNILITDIHKTQYHGGPYQHWMNEPHAPFYYNGKYHLFFQFNLDGPYFHNICWGHLISDDLVNWKPLKEIITPTSGTVCPDGVWSGGATLDGKGNPILFFTAGDDAKGYTSGLISNQNIGIARPKDLSDPELKEWVVSDEYAIKQVAGQGKAGEFRDAYIYRDENNGKFTWYMLVCSSNGSNRGTALIYTTQDDKFTSWDYKGEVYKMPTSDSAPYGRTWELPVLVPLQNESKTVSKWLFIFSPAPAADYDASIYYLLGEFDKTTCRFTPDDATPKKFDFGPTVFTGPSILLDPVTKKAEIFSIMQDLRGPAAQHDAGWAHCVGLTREVYLSDDGATAYIKPINKLKEYEKEVLLSKDESMTIAQANEALKAVKGDMLHVEVTFSVPSGVLSGTSGSFGVYLRTASDKSQYAEYGYSLESKKAYLTATGSEGLRDGVTINGELPYTISGNTLKTEFYVDRSLIEGFYDGKLAGSARAYLKSTSNGVQVFSDNADGVTVTHIRVASMKSIYSEN